MRVERIEELSRYFRDELLHNLLPFWVPRMVDREHGGFLTFLDRDGSVLATDKSIWIQGRVTWLFARLYNSLERRGEWLSLSRHGADFLRSHGFDADGRMFFTVTREGRPLRKRRYLFSECFAVMAFSELARATGDAESLRLAEQILATILRYHTTPGLLEPKVNPSTRRTRGHAMPMILVNVLQVLRENDAWGGSRALRGGSPSRGSPMAAARYNALINQQIDEIFRYFVRPEKKALLETVGENGEILDSPQGRCVNPGHALESAWFLLEEARHRGDQGLMERTLPIIDWSLELGWDPVHGGILYFVDVEGKPPEQLEWDMKLSWVHNEALYACLLAHHMSGEERYERWFEKILAWTLAHFPDREQGEWFGYLHRDGSVSLPFKGNNWKGPYHEQRQFLLTHLLLEEMAGRGVRPRS
jgi:N-acylglucosamine 2-epimerase